MAGWHRAETALDRGSENWVPVLTPEPLQQAALLL